jgi:hypothetical protein
MRRRRLLALSAAFVLLALAGGAGAAPNPVKRPPSLLWKSYPLEQPTAASPHEPLRPPALAVGSGSSSGGGFSPDLALLALLGGATLALTALLGKSLIKDGATMMAEKQGRSAEPEPAPSEDARPDMLVALRPSSVTAEEERDPVESQRKTPVVPRPAQIEDEGEVKPEQSEQAPPVPLRPIRVVLRPLLRPIEEQQPEVEAPPAEEEEPESEAQPASAAEAATEPQSESEPDSKRLWREAAPEMPKHLWREASPKVPKDVWREASPKEDTEVVVEICQIRLWRGYVRYQLYAALGRDGVGRTLAHSPYFRLKDPEAPGAEAKAALRDLLDRLEAGGWTVAQEGRRWYSFILKRPL